MYLFPQNVAHAVWALDQLIFSIQSRIGVLIGSGSTIVCAPFII
jgi:hypothetical protein